MVHFGAILYEEDHAGGEAQENDALGTYTLGETGRVDVRVAWAPSETVDGTRWPEPPRSSYPDGDESGYSMGRRETYSGDSPALAEPRGR